MKRIIICPVCGKPTGYYKSFAATLERFQEYQGVPLPTKKQKVRICKVCVKEAGYKVKPEKKEE